MEKIEVKDNPLGLDVYVNGSKTNSITNQMMGGGMMGGMQGGGMHGGHM